MSVLKPYFPPLLFLKKEKKKMGRGEVVTESIVFSIIVGTLPIKEIEQTVSERLHSKS